MAKKFIRTNKSIFDAIPDKSLYSDSIVFIEDSNEIWSNGIYYAGNSSEDTNILYDLETGLDLNGDLVKTVGKLVIDSNGRVYSNNSLVVNNISINGSILDKDENGAVDLGTISSGNNIIKETINNTEDVLISLNPNTYYVLTNTVKNITISLNELDLNNYSKYFIEFSGNYPSVTFTDDILFDKNIIPNFNLILDFSYTKFILEFDNNLCNIIYTNGNKFPPHKLTYNIDNITEVTKLLSDKIDDYNYYELKITKQ